MAWVGPSEREQDSKRTGCLLLRELPARPTQRTGKLSADLEKASHELDLEVYDGNQIVKEKQLEAFQEAWQDINATIKDLRQHTLAPVYKQLLAWAAAHAPVASAQQSRTNSSSAAEATPSAEVPTLCGSHQLPILALSVASSTNTSATYAELLVTLKSKGHPVALVQARSATGLPSIINSAMRSFLNESTAADDVPALLAWWHDTCQQHNSTAGHFAAAATAEQTARAGQRGQAAASSSGMDINAATPQRAKAGTAATTPARELRARTPAKTPGKAGAMKGNCSEVKPLGPPVLVLQEADCGDFEALEELVVALSEARVAGLPIVLVLGVSITPSHLLQLLPNGLLRRAQLTTLALPPARTQLSQLYRAFLLRGPQPPLVLGPKVLDWLLQHFRDVDCSAAMTERVLQLACAEHYRQQHLSCLAAAAASGSRKLLAKTVKQLEPEQLLLSCRALLAQPTLTAAVVTHQNAASHTKSPTAHQDNRSAGLKQLQDFVAAKGSSKDKLAAAAADVLVESMWGGMQAYGQWRLGALLLDVLAKFTGAADVDASLQLPAIYTAASQPNFLTVKKKGNLSSCGKLLLKLLGTTSSSSRARSGVTVVHALSDPECVELLAKLVELVTDAQLTHKQRRKQLRRKQHAAAAGAAEGGQGDVGSSSDGSDSSGSDSDSDGDGAEVDSAVASSGQVQQLQQALSLLKAAAGGAQPAAAAVADAMVSPSKRRRRESQSQQAPEESEDQGQLGAFADQFKQLLTPLQDILESAAPAAGQEMPVISTPAAKGQRAAGAAGEGQDAVTPGGLASMLRKQVRFAPDTPDHANGKHVGSSTSARSTPENMAATPVPGLIKTPNKKGAGATQPKRLFGAAAAANAAAAAAAKQPRRKKGDKKQANEEGEIAGSSAAVLAAAAGLAQSPAGLAAAAGNKRSQRLMRLMGPSGAGAAAATGSKKGPGSGSSTPERNAALGRSRGAPVTVPAGNPAAAAAGDAEAADHMMLSPRANRARNSRSNGQAQAANADNADGMIISPVVGRAAGAGPSRGGSRLSRQSVPALQQHDEADSDHAASDHHSDAEEQQTAAAAVAVQQEQLEPAPAAAPTCASMLASLLEAAVPKLLLDWCCPGAVARLSSDGAIPLTSSSSLLAAAAAAAAFVYDDLDSVSRLLSPAPPCAVHAALLNPSQKLAGHPQHIEQGCEDTCLAYVLLQQQREDSLAVSDWFGLFCQADGVQGFKGSEGGLVGYNDDSDAEDTAADKAPAGRAAMRKARTGRKARGYAEARESAAAGGPSSSVKGSKKQQATPKSAAKKRAGSSKDDEQAEIDEAAVDEEELLSAAARFCQAAAELQMLGIWKAAKKRRMAAVHRVFAPEGQLFANAGMAEVESLADHEYE